MRCKCTCWRPPPVAASHPADGLDCSIMCCTLPRLCCCTKRNAAFSTPGRVSVVPALLPPSFPYPLPRVSGCLFLSPVPSRLMQRRDCAVKDIVVITSSELMSCSPPPSMLLLPVPTLTNPTVGLKALFLATGDNKEETYTAFHQAYPPCSLQALLDCCTKGECCSCSRGEAATSPRSIGSLLRPVVQGGCQSCTCS